MFLSYGCNWTQVQQRSQYGFAVSSPPMRSSGCLRNLNTTKIKETSCQIIQILQNCSPLPHSCLQSVGCCVGTRVSQSPSAADWEAMPEPALSFEIRICRYMSFLLTNSPLINLQVMANRVCQELTNACLHEHAKQRVVVVFRGDWMPRIQI